MNSLTHSFNILQYIRLKKHFSSLKNTNIVDFFLKVNGGAKWKHISKPQEYKMRPHRPAFHAVACHDSAVASVTPLLCDSCFISQVPGSRWHQRTSLSVCRSTSSRLQQVSDGTVTPEPAARFKRASINNSPLPIYWLVTWLVQNKTTFCHFNVFAFVSAGRIWWKGTKGD